MPSISGTVTKKKTGKYASYRKPGLNRGRTSPGRTPGARNCCTHLMKWYLHVNAKPRSALPADSRLSAPVTPQTCKQLRCCQKWFPQYLTDHYFRLASRVLSFLIASAAPRPIGI